MCSVVLISKGIACAWGVVGGAGVVSLFSRPRSSILSKFSTPHAELQSRGRSSNFDA